MNNVKEVISVSNPIGVFDSGVGGISILIEIRKALPNEDLIYFADSGNCPYGTKPETEIRARALKIADFLVAKGVKCMVIACNAACTAGLDQIRKRYPELPVIGIEPAIKPACETTKNSRVGVLSTPMTLEGERFAKLVAKYGGNVEIIPQPAPGLADLVEAGEFDTKATKDLLNGYLQPLIARRIDTLLLGCTHYPFVRPLIQKICGAGIKIIDNGAAVAGQLARVLAEKGLREINPDKGMVDFYTSGMPELVKKVIQQLWPEPVNQVFQAKI